jgi:diacylglycerol kinase (ATP)
MNLDKKYIAVLVNPLPANQRARSVADQIDILLKGMSVQHQVFFNEWPEDLKEYTDAWIVGGDGTVNFFINNYPEVNLHLSVFAGGTGNDFHWMLYGKISVEEQVEKILSLTPVTVDAGVCNGKLFLNGIGIGFDGAIVKDLLGKKKFPGKASYLVSILKHIAGFREFPCQIEYNNSQVNQDCFMISVANAARYGGGFHVAPKAVLNDGLLDISVVGKISALKRLRYLPVMEKGEHLHLPFINYSHEASVSIKADKLLPAHADGEYFEAMEFNVQVLPGRFSFLY